MAAATPYRRNYASNNIGPIETRDNQSKTYKCYYDCDNMPGDLLAHKKTHSCGAELYSYGDRMCPCFCGAGTSQPSAGPKGVCPRYVLITTYQW